MGMDRLYKALRCVQKMHGFLSVLLITTCVFADEGRRSKLPYIVDAVGNNLPPPSNVPATVGSPVNLLTPDRYEFYTFDESGELVKRLMTLEEIQAIVAAGEETEGLVTIANNNQPTVAFNFSQPSYSKVHNVVTNVQNVLKAQMEAHKNKSNIPPTLDTPDVSDSWSLILPSIFGNTGVDIVPDKTSESFITPETDTIDSSENVNDNYQSKENILEPINTNNDISTKVEITTIPSTSTITTNRMTTKKPLITTSVKPVTQTVSIASSTPTTLKTRYTTQAKKKLSITSTTKPKFTVTTPKPSESTSIKLQTTTKSDLKTTPVTKDTTNTSKNSLHSTQDILTTKPTPIFEKINTFISNNTNSSIKDKITEVINTSFNMSTIKTSTLTTPSFSTSTTNNFTLVENNEKTSSVPEEKYSNINLTTITTQSVSPFTISSTEFTTVHQINIIDDEKSENSNTDNNNNNEEPVIPLFDVAQSISQIASDLGGNYAPLPTTSNFLDTKKINNLPVESKESLEIDISETTPDSEKNTTDVSFENFVQISTLEPHKNDSLYNPVTNERNNVTSIYSTQNSITILSTSTTTYPSQSTANTIDPILSNSVGDMLSQVINQNPEPQLMNNMIDELLFTTQTNIETTTLANEILSTTIIAMESDTTILPVTTDKSDEINNKTNEMGKEVAVKIDNNGNTIDKNINNTTNSNNIQQKETTKVSNVTEIELKTEISNINFDDKNQKTSSNNTNQLITEASIELINKFKTSPAAFESLSNKNISALTQKVIPNKNTSQTNTLETFKDHQELPKFDEFKKKIQKVNIDEKELATERNNLWKLIPTVPPPKALERENVKQKLESFPSSQNIPDVVDDKNIILDFSKENQGLEVTTKNLGEDVLQFTELCNELAFKYWHEIIQHLDVKRSFVLSPYSITSMLAMMFMGARGVTSGEMNEILKLDDMVTFNPHFTLKNISDSIETSSSSGVAASAFVRELYSERNKGKVLTFYKERAHHFYNGHVEEVNFKVISDIIRRRTNLLVKRFTWGKIQEHIKTNSIVLHPPLAAFSVNIFETDCSGSSVDGRDGEMYFVVSPNVRQRRLVPVPAVVYKNNFLAGYDPVLDATAAALGNTNSMVSTLFLMPGQQGNVVNAEDLEILEKRLLDSKPTASWNRLLRTLLPRIGLELQIPRFSHKSMLNISSSLKNMGLKELFDADHADLGGLNGPSKELYLSDMMQLTTFVTCGEGFIGEQHHIEEYPEILSQKRRTSRWATIWDEPRDYQRAFHDPHDLGDAMHLPLHLRPRQARLPARNTQPARLKFDRPFLFFVRHNPTGMILYVGRYNPRLLP